MNDAWLGSRKVKQLHKKPFSHSTFKPVNLPGTQPTPHPLKRLQTVIFTRFKAAFKAFFYLTI